VVRRARQAGVPGHDRERAVSAELSCPWFRRELRLSRRENWRWQPAIRFGPNCPATLRGKILVNGLEFSDEQAAARFDLAGLLMFNADAGPERPVRRLLSWEDGEAWVRAGYWISR
jgi:hypothetical protein